MGLFSGHRRLFRAPELRSPIRFHSRYTLGSAAGRLFRMVRKLPGGVIAASNDARVVGALLMLAAAALAAEMAISLRR